MKADQVYQALQEKFFTEDERIIFWVDAQREFSEFLKEGLPGKLSEVTVLFPETEGGLAVKNRIEINTQIERSKHLSRAEMVEGDPPTRRDDSRKSFSAVEMEVCTTVEINPIRRKSIVGSCSRDSQFLSTC